MNVCMRSVRNCNCATAKVMIEQKRKAGSSTSPRPRVTGAQGSDGLYDGKGGRLESDSFHRREVGAGRHLREFRLAEPHRLSGGSTRRAVKSFREKFGRPARRADGYRQGGGVHGSDESELLDAIDLLVDCGALAIRD